MFKPYVFFLFHFFFLDILLRTLKKYSGGTDAQLPGWAMNEKWSLKLPYTKLQ